IFHSDPLVFGQPSNITYLRANAGSDQNPVGATCGATNETDTSFDRGYTCFFKREQFRRQVVYVGSNDGFFHAFNAGEFQKSTNHYDGGTGNEAFAYMPRAVMPSVKSMAEG